jgi:hypothetical protein
MQKLAICKFRLGFQGERNRFKFHKEALATIQSNAL